MKRRVKQKARTFGAFCFGELGENLSARRSYRGVGIVKSDRSSGAHRPQSRPCLDPLREGFLAPGNRLVLNRRRIRTPQSDEQVAFRALFFFIRSASKDFAQHFVGRSRTKSVNQMLFGARDRERLAHWFASLTDNCPYFCFALYRERENRCGRCSCAIEEKRMFGQTTAATRRCHRLKALSGKRRSIQSTNAPSQVRKDLAKNNPGIDFIG